ncbi:hypothetical protein [Allorhodopirellula solitaria]|uniref:Uncharacterized protein n=1 Tax=Allorhodopirellula solitaria TaxID=2527987 RepID=A0A5C5YK67_9BACT|nr:hypothetical protein [Allorhodopirellula solitaria]TWT75306.1 hypothetical protein CA85_05960 [Allorhodopirellula solitaria]
MQSKRTKPTRAFHPWLFSLLTLPVVAVLLGLTGSGIALACPFCSAISQTLRQEMEIMDAVVIASAMQSDATRNADTGEVEMKIETVLKGSSHVEAGQTVTAVYFGDVAKGRRFLLSGADPNDMQWSCLPLTPRAEQYVIRIPDMAKKEGPERLRFYMLYLQDDDSMLARDAYDEFAVSPYADVQAIREDMDHDQLITWIQDESLSPDRKRLYLTMLGVCGTTEDLPMLEEMLKSTQKTARTGMDALIACYLTLAGESGLELINEQFLLNKQASYADTYAAIMAIRFHGTEGGVIARSALVESLHHILDRDDLADLVIPDLARWEDWSQVEKLKDLFLNADPENNWVRVPVVNYLRACPKPEAAEALEELEKADPASVRRANTFFAVPKPAADTVQPSKQ